MPNVNEFMRQAQVMQSKIAKAEADLSAKTFEASSGGGMVKAVVLGKNQLQSLIIDPKAVEDVDMLQDLIIAAVNEANRIAAETWERELTKISGGIKIPGLH